MMISTILIEDHALVRDGIKLILSNHDQIHIVAEADTGKMGINYVRQYTPQIVLLDFRLPDIDGLSVIHKIDHFSPHSKVIVLTAVDDQEVSFRLLSAGARGYLTKGTSGEELIKAILKVYAGGYYIINDISNHLAIAKVRGDSEGAFAELSKREFEVAMLFARGCATQAIAELLSLSTKTVNSYKYRILEKLNISNTVQLARLAIKYGVSDIDEDIS